MKHSILKTGSTYVHQHGLFIHTCLYCVYCLTSCQGVCMPTLQHLSAAPPTGVLLPLAVDCSSPLASPGGSDTHSRRRPTLSSAHALAPRVDFDPAKPYPWKEQSSVRCRCICAHSGPSDRLQQSHCKHKYKRAKKGPDWPSMSGPPQVYLA